MALVSEHPFSYMLYYPLFVQKLLFLELLGQALLMQTYTFTKQS
jgi:hypothetical protein